VGSFGIGWSASNFGDIYGFAIAIYNGSNTVNFGSHTYWLGLDSVDTEGLSIALVLRQQGGGFLLLKTEGQWRLFYPSISGTTGTLYSGCEAERGATSVDYMRIVDLPAPWNADTGFPVANLTGAVADDTTFSHPADGRLEFTCTTVPAGNAIHVAFRYQDGNNYWFIDIPSTGQFNLWERVGGVDTLRGFAGDGTISNGNKCVILMDGPVIQGYSNNTSRWTYSSATNFQTLTDGVLTTLGTGGVVSDIRTWTVDHPTGYGLATAWLPGYRLQGDTFIHEADSLIEFVVDTLPSVFSLYINMRTQGAGNTWYVRIDGDGGFYLIEQVGGGDTERGSAGAGTISNGHLVVVILEGQTIRGYSNNVLRWTYAAAANFQTETDGSVSGLGTGGQVSNLITWPRNISGSALNGLLQSGGAS
jgi:hypothetical protein